MVEMYLIDGGASSMCKHTIKSIQEALDRALIKLRRNEIDIISNDISERAITHKLAEYLQKEFPDYNVDCEYNRDYTRGHGHPKSLYLLNNDLDKVLNSQKLSNDSFQSIAECVTTYPDIIVHRRKSNASNLLLIEMKKCSSKVSCEFDDQKLKAFTGNLNGNEYDFHFGVLLLLHVGDSWLDPVEVWYKDGKELRIENPPCQESCPKCWRKISIPRSNG